jgi:hypothetical protein
MEKLVQLERAIRPDLYANPNGLKSKGTVVTIPESVPANPMAPAKKPRTRSKVYHPF